MKHSCHFLGLNVATTPLLQKLYPSASPSQSYNQSKLVEYPMTEDATMLWPTEDACLLLTYHHPPCLLLNSFLRFSNIAPTIQTSWIADPVTFTLSRNGQQGAPSPSGISHSELMQTGNHTYLHALIQKVVSFAHRKEVLNFLQMPPALRTSCSRAFFQVSLQKMETQLTWDPRREY